jgi:hypothetical protein
MSVQMLMFIGEPYGIDQDREHLPFRVRQVVDLRYLNANRNNLEKLYKDVCERESDYRKVDCSPFLSDAEYTSDDRNPLRMLPIDIVLKALRKDVRNSYWAHYEMAINAIETCVKHYPDTHVVLFMCC